MIGFVSLFLFVVFERLYRRNPKGQGSKVKGKKKAEKSKAIRHSEHREESK